jgi:predicted lipoprotein
MKRLLAALALTFGAIAPLHAQTADHPQPAAVSDVKAQDQRAMALELAEKFVVPAYQDLAKAADAQESAWKGFCKKPSKAGIDGLKKAYNDAADAWARIEFVRYGPIGENFRYERMAYWPERKNAVARSLAKAIREPDKLTPERFKQASVAVQGLSAMERLLYDDGATDALLSGPEAARRCEIGQAISLSVATIAGEALEGWRGKGGMIDTLKTADEATVRETVSRLGTDLLGVYQAIGDLKLDAVTGMNPSEARPTLAETWRSGRSARAIAENFAGVKAMTEVIVGDDTEHGEKVLAAIQRAHDEAAGLPAPLGEMAEDEKARPKLTELRQSVRTARDLSGAYIPARLGIVIGFNSLDGD